MATSVCVTSFRILMRFTGRSHMKSGLHVTSAALPIMSTTDVRWRTYVTTKNQPYSEKESCDTDGCTIEFINGLPNITVPLPSRNEKCRFTLKPVTNNVADFIEMLKIEDRGIDRAAIMNKNGIRIASTCSIASLMDEPFWIHINDQTYKAVPPTREKVELETLNKLDDVRALVTQLYEALNVGEYHYKKEQEIIEKLENLHLQLAPLERKKSELSAQAERKTTIMSWVGLGLMSVQFGILARLTWWEYSWDIMEPVTYFVTYGTAMAMFAYYCVTKTEYNIYDVKDREYLLALHKRAKRKNFNVDEYNELKRQVAEAEYNLKRLRDPLNLQLPGHIERSQRFPPVDRARFDESQLSKEKTSNIFKSLSFLDTKK